MQNPRHVNEYYACYIGTPPTYRLMENGSVTEEEEEEEEEEEDDDEDEDEDEDKEGNHGQNVEITFSDIMYILHHNTTNFCVLVTLIP